MDYNLTRRATFNSCTQHSKKLHHPNNETLINFDLADNEIFVASRIEIACVSTWSNWCPIGPAGTHDVAKNILNHIGTTSNGMQQEESSAMATWFRSINNGKCGSVKPVTYVKNCNPYSGIDISNGRCIIKSPEFFQVFIILYGTKFICTSHLPLKKQECIGFAMQSPDKQGTIILDESNNDHLFDYIVQVGGPDFRQLPFSMQAYKELPEVFQYSLMNKLFTPKLALPAEEAKALPNPDELISQFIADGFEADFPLEQLKGLARHMLSKGWKK